MRGKGTKEEERRWANIYFSQVCLDEREMRVKKIEGELFSFIYLCGKVKGKKKIKISNDNIILMLL